MCLHLIHEQKALGRPTFVRVTSTDVAKSKGQRSRLAYHTLGKCTIANWQVATTQTSNFMTRDYVILTHQRYKL